MRFYILYKMILNGFVKSKGLMWRGAGAAAGAKGVPTMSLFVPTGAVLGVPLTIIQNVFTNIHYGYDITTFQSVGLQFLIGYYTYGKDRYKDALEYQDAPYPTEKADMYGKLVENAGFYAPSFDVSFALIACIMLFECRDGGSLPFLLLLYSCEFYKDLKRVLPLAKPVYVSTMWTLSTVVLPCVLHDHDFSILNDASTYLPCFLTMFAFTNVADIRDVDVDRANGINTIPVEYGAVRTATIAQVALLLSSVAFATNPHYLNRPIVNALVELHNAALSGYLLVSTLDDVIVSDTNTNTNTNTDNELS